MHRRALLCASRGSPALRWISLSGKVQAALQRLKDEMAPEDIDKLLAPEQIEEETASTGTSAFTRPAETAEALANARAAKEAQLLRQRTLGMEMRQRARLARAEGAHRAAVERLEKACEVEFVSLITEQTEEMQEFTEACTRYATRARAQARPAVPGSALLIL